MSWPILYSLFKIFSFSFDFKVYEETSVGSVTSVSFERFNLKYRDFAITQARHVANTRFLNTYSLLSFSNLRHWEVFLLYRGILYIYRIYICCSFTVYSIFICFRFTVIGSYISHHLTNSFPSFVHDTELMVRN